MLEIMLANIECIPKLERKNEDITFNVSLQFDLRFNFSHTLKTE